MLSGCLVARSHAVQCSYSRTGAQHFIPRMDRVVFQFIEVGTLPGTGAVVRPPWLGRALQCWWCAWLWTAAGPEVSTEQELRKLPVPTQTDSSGSGIPAAVLPPPTIARVSSRTLPPRWHNITITSQCQAQSVYLIIIGSDLTLFSFHYNNWWELNDNNWVIPLQKEWVRASLHPLITRGECSSWSRLGPATSTTWAVATRRPGTLARYSEGMVALCTTIVSPRCGRGRPPPCRTVAAQAAPSSGSRGWSAASAGCRSSTPPWSPPSTGRLRP